MKPDAIFQQNKAQFDIKQKDEILHKQHSLDEDLIFGWSMLEKIRLTRTTTKKEVNILKAVADIKAMLVGGS